MSNKNVKLGELANSFYDPVTQVKVLPGQVVQLEKAQYVSKKTATALRHGHLVLASDEEVEAFESGQPISNNDPSNDQDKNWDEFDGYNEKDLGKLKKGELVELAMYLESEYSQEELNEMNKSDLVEEILEIYEEKE